MPTGPNKFIPVPMGPIVPKRPTGVAYPEYAEDQGAPPTDPDAEKQHDLENDLKARSSGG